MSRFKWDIQACGVLLSFIALDAHGATIIPAGLSSISGRASTTHYTDFFDRSGPGNVVITRTVSASEHQSIQNNQGDTTQVSTENASASGFAGNKAIGAHAYAIADAASGDNTFYGAGTFAFSDAYLKNFFQIDNPALTGQNGTMVVPLFVTGSVQLGGGGGGLFGHSDGRAYATLWATGLAPLDNTCPQGAPACNGQTFDSISGGTSFGGSIPGTLELKIPFIFGSTSSFYMQLHTRAEAGATARNGNANLYALAGFMNTVAWGGISQILDENGNVVQGWTIQSAEGVDLTTPYSTPVPLPAAWILVASGMGVVCSVRRKDWS